MEYTTKNNKKALGQLSGMLLLTLCTQALLVMKSSRVAALYGTGIEMDAYNFVNNIATFVFSFIGTGVGTVLIPYMAREKDTRRAQNGFLTILYGCSIVVLGIFFVFRRPFLTLFSGHSEQFVDIASQLMAVILFSQLVTSLNHVSTAYLNCKNCFNLPKLLALLVTLAGTAVVYLVDAFSIYQYVALTFVLILGEMAVQYFVAIRKGFRYTPCIAFGDPELRNIFRIFLPTVFGAGVYQLTLMTDSMISATLGEGNLSILSYAGTISNMVNTVVAGNIMIYIYPKIAAEVNQENSKKKLLQYMVLFAALICAVVVLFVAAGFDAVQILFERGEFQSDATKGVFLCVLIYLLGAPINVMRDLVYRYFYSKGNTKGTFYNGLTASLLNIIASIILARFMGLYGIVLGTTVTAVFSFATILLRMKQQYGFGGHFPFFVTELFKLIAPTAGAVLGCLAIKALLLAWPSLAVSALAAAVSILLYGAILLLSRSKVFQVELR
jgi:murein biosynthesis integral membrane protein MurJ